MNDYDINFYWDPVCPFAWMTSKWIRTVQAQKDYRVDWRFISLRLINKDVDYAAHFPPEYEAGHTSGLRLLRVAAAARSEHGRDAIESLYEAMGSSIFEVDQATAREQRARSYVGSQEHAAATLEAAGLPTELATAADDEAWDDELDAETSEALALTGKDVGTPIIHYTPPDGPALFGPVISRLPTDDQAVELWDHVIGLASFPGFTEIKRSLRELPQLRALGVTEDKAGKVEDWHGGSRRQKK